MPPDIGLSDISDLIKPETKHAIEMAAPLPPMDAWLQWVQQTSDDSTFDGYGLRDHIACLLKQGSARRFRTEYPFDVIRRFVIGRITQDRERRRFHSVTSNEWVMNRISNRHYLVYLSSDEIHEYDVPSAPVEGDHEGFVDLFHGTNEDSAIGICQQGVSVYAGRVPADYGQGFYLGPWQIAFNRAAAIASDYNDNIALLHWRIPERDLHRLMPHVVLKEPDHVWQKLTVYFRSLGRDQAPVEDIHNAHYIHGPIVANTTEVPRKAPIPVQLSDGQIPMQWAFHTDHSVQLLNKHQARIMLFRLPLA